VNPLNKKARKGYFAGNFNDPKSQQIPNNMNNYIYLKYVSKLSINECAMAQMLKDSV